MENIIVHPHTPMADVIQKHHVLIPVIQRFGINLGFGDKTVNQLCHEHRINTSFFLDIVNTFIYKEYFPREKMQSYSIKTIVDYLKATHHYYNNTVLPAIEKDITQLRQSCRKRCENMRLIDTFYQNYKSELLQHIRNEEEKFFPFAIAIAYGENPSRDLKILHKQYGFSYAAHYKEHEEVIEKLTDLKNILIKYVPPDYDKDIGNDLLARLFAFEQDINDHERLEDIILVPALKKAERQFIQS